MPEPMAIRRISGSVTPNLASLLFLVAFLVFGAADVVAELVEADWLARILIFLPMPMLLGYVLSRTRPSRALVRWLIAAIIFSWLGDGFGNPILLKIIFFAVAQLCYLLAFLPYRRAALRRIPLVVLIGIGVVAMISFLVPLAGSLVVPVIVYALLVGGMTVLAGGLGWRGVIGGLVFFCSDTILALQVFVPTLVIPGQGALVMLTYLTAQLLLALAMLDQRTGLTVTAERP